MFARTHFARVLTGAALLAVPGMLSASVHAQGDEATRTLIAARLAPFSYGSVPLGQEGVGPWRRVQISGHKTSEAILTLDPNRFEWNGYSPNWLSTRMAPVQIPITLRPAGGLPPRKNGAAKIYEIRAKELPPGIRFDELGLGDRLRLVIGEAGQPLRLLSLNSKGEMQGVIPLEKEGLNAVPPSAIFTDTFSLESVVLTTPLEGVRQIRIQGSLNAGTAKLILDRNAKTLDVYGDPDISTLMAPLPLEVKLVEKKDTGDAGKMVRVFDLEGLPSTITQKFRLVIAKTFEGNNRLLAVNAAGQAMRVIPLEAVVPVTGRLVGTAWQLEKIGYAANKTVTPGTDQTYQISFLPGGRLGGRAEMNRMIGTYTIADNSLTVAPLASTRTAYGPNSIAPAFLKALSDVASYMIVNGKLVLRLKSNSGTMTFTAQR